jgi:hypothetical protein
MQAQFVPYGTESPSATIDQGALEVVDVCDDEEPQPTAAHARAISTTACPARRTLRMSPSS